MTEKHPYVADMEIRVVDGLYEAAWSWAVRLKPRLYVDGDQWCALYGANLPDGVAGFGDTPEQAFADFDKNFRMQKVAAREAPISNEDGKQCEARS